MDVHNWDSPRYTLCHRAPVNAQVPQLPFQVAQVSEMLLQEL